MGTFCRLGPMFHLRLAFVSFATRSPKLCCPCLFLPHLVALSRKWSFLVVLIVLGGTVFDVSIFVSIWA